MNKESEAGSDGRKGKLRRELRVEFHVRAQDQRVPHMAVNTLLIRHLTSITHL